MSNQSRAEAQLINTSPRKLRLADLQVQSFVTALDAHETSQIAGGYPWITRVTECINQSINLCENVSVFHPEKGC
jgi:hypothetical protein